MGNKVRISYAENFRETILLMTVLYVIWPLREVRTTSIDIACVMIWCFAFGSMLFTSAKAIIRESKLFLWDKVIFIISLLVEGGLMAVRPFVNPLPISLSWIALVWACAMMIAGIALIGIYPTLEKKGKWKSPLPAEEAGGMAFTSYMTISVSLLAISHVIFYL